MYAVCVRDHLMIAHSFRGAVFGPAQRLHGATYVIDLIFRRGRLDADGVVVDIGRAGEVLREIVAEFNFRNLDELPEFSGLNTTTEVMARVIFDRMAARIAAGALGDGALGISALEVKLHESHVAWASYQGELPGQVPDQLPDQLPDQ